VLARAQQDAVWDRQQAANKLRVTAARVLPDPARRISGSDQLRRPRHTRPGAHPGRSHHAAPPEVARGAGPGRTPPQPRPPGRADPGRATGRAVPPTRADRAGHTPDRALAHLRALNAAVANIVELVMAAFWHPTECTGAPTTWPTPSAAWCWRCPGCPW